MTLTRRLALFFLAALAVVLGGFSAALYVLADHHRWPALVITLALLLTLLWTGTFVWLIYHMCRLLLSALF